MSTLDSPSRTDGSPAADDSWVAQAACVGRTVLFFPPYAERPQARLRREQRARALCAGCPVAEPCRQSGREHHEYGIWGGENEEQRMRAGYALMAPVGTRHLRRVSALAMPLAELTDPTAADLDDAANWIAELA